MPMNLPPRRALNPLYWPLWLGAGLFWLLVRILPWRWLMKLGAGLGRLAELLLKRRRHIAEVNLRLCFPELTEKERLRLRHAHFAALGMGIFETLLAWWGSDARIKPLARVEGIEHLRAAYLAGKGVIMLSAHQTCLEIGARCAHQAAIDLGEEYRAMLENVHAVYRPNQNPAVEWITQNGRGGHAQKIISRDNAKDMIRSLKQGKVLWYALDQNYGHKNSVFANFFGIPAATNTATTRLVKLTGAAVVFFSCHRTADGYMAIFQPALDNFPGASEQADAERVNLLIEQATRAAPEQYLWVHRRFKDRPDGGSVY
jgi:KDO2-lipid IV(A) lauroyltransferase